jgi:hypothetical protein
VRELARVASVADVPDQVLIGELVQFTVGKRLKGHDGRTTDTRVVEGEAKLTQGIARLRRQVARCRGDITFMAIRTDTRFHLGEPQISGPLTVYPIFGPEPTVLYRSLSHAVAHGAFITEVDEDGDVNDVLVFNASAHSVLLYEGELITGARQNRTIDQPVLIPAGAQVSVPVSCVERERWDDRRRSDRFTVATHTPDPRLRRAKRATANRRHAGGDEPRPDQVEVWEQIEMRLELHDVAAPRRAFDDVFVARRTALDQLTRRIHALNRQLGAVAVIAGEPVALDFVSRPDVFADLLPGLADGYALQALELSYATDPPRPAQCEVAAREFLRQALHSRRRRAPTPGIGDGFVAIGRGIVGCGLRAERELVALSAFPANRD